MRGLFSMKNGDVVAALQPLGAVELRHAVGRRLVLGEGHDLAAVAHDEQRLVGVVSRMLGGVHRRGPYDDGSAQRSGPWAESGARGCRNRRIATIAKVVVVAVVVLIAAGNLLIVGASEWLRQTSGGAPTSMDGVSNLRVVDDHVWRGAAPTRDGYRSLADAGVETIVDLRAEEDVAVDTSLLHELGLRRVTIPVRDGQAPSAGDVERFLSVVAGADGLVFLHCGAGVGRTGAMAAAYLSATDQADGSESVLANLAIGPPSLEQLAFVADLDDAHVPRPNPAVVAVSRVLDAPRRLWASTQGRAPSPSPDDGVPYAVVVVLYVIVYRNSRPAKSPVVAPLLEVLEVGHGAARVAEEPVDARRRLALVVVVAGRAVGGADHADARGRVEELHPGVLAPPW